MKRYFSVFSIISLIESVRSSDRWLLRVVLAAVLVAAIWLILSINSAVSVSDIRSGGTLTEGIVGTPRFVNPVLALTRADQDVTALLYGRLLTIDADGALVPDIAKDWALSEDMKTYTITLRENVLFHDNMPLTTKDVIYTIELIQNDELKSPLRSNWSGATVSAIDDYTFEIQLEEVYAPFIENLTIGILPAHIWKEIPVAQVPFSSYNTTPIGSGPYKIQDTSFSNSGAVAEYKLAVHESHEPAPLLTELVLKFYPDETALVAAWDKEISSTAYLPPATISSQIDLESYTTQEIPLTRTFGLFFNQNRSVVLRDAAVREALEIALDRDSLIEQGLGGAGIPTASAVNLTEDDIELENFHAESGTSSKPTPLALATMVLEDAGWNQTDDGTWEKDDDGDTIPLEVTIRTVNTPVFGNTLTALAKDWEALGISVVTEQFTQSDLVQSVIRERDFEILLFGIDPGRSEDIYPFWHSSQQNDPGLNISQYTNLTVDEALEVARTSNDSTERAGALSTVRTVIQDERPAIFLFQPTVQYVVPKELEVTLSTRFSRPADRFSTITSWYTEQQLLWPFFTETPRNETDLDTSNQ